MEYLRWLLSLLFLVNNAYIFVASLKEVDNTSETFDPLRDRHAYRGFDEYLDDNMAKTSLATNCLEETGGAKAVCVRSVSLPGDTFVYLFSYWTSPSSTTYESTAAFVEEGVIVDRLPPIVSSLRLHGSLRQGA